MAKSATGLSVLASINKFLLFLEIVSLAKFCPFMLKEFLLNLLLVETICNFSLFEGAHSGWIVLNFEKWPFSEGQEDPEHMRPQHLRIRSSQKRRNLWELV
ncbi:uncharacterized protein LOC117181175 [Belonocnema kinseyi]|uniref:uncharacterized protein LOC117181175 n=1 Tax=Belonocnema kinseyi TaxID=2817044 RepID=UPI00143D30CF|nr:uncharacterized protein LOC117181175 [Belonocnema kinseyi]